MTPSLSDFLAAFDLFREAILCGAIAGLTLGAMGVLIVLRRMVFVTAAVTQAAGLGVALGILAGTHTGEETGLVLWAIGTSMVAAGVLALDPARVRLSRESVLALVWLVGSGGAVLVGDRIHAEAHDVSAILFGSAVLVRPLDLYTVAGFSGLALAVLALTHRGLIFAGYDRDGARVQGLPVRLLELGFLALVTVEVSVATRALGALPVFAFSVLPGMAGLLGARGVRGAMLAAAAGGVGAAVLGYLAAFFLSFPVGASQAAVAVGLVLLALPVRWVRG